MVNVPGKQCDGDEEMGTERKSEYEKKGQEGKFGSYQDLPRKWSLRVLLPFRYNFYAAAKERERTSIPRVTMERHCHGQHRMVVQGRRETLQRLVTLLLISTASKSV